LQDEASSALKTSIEGDLMGGRTNPVVWDPNVCHTYWYVYFGQGNVAQNIFEGDAPPPPPPPPPPGLNFCPIPPWCP
jgi:hypothetical protein